MIDASGRQISLPFPTMTDAVPPWDVLCATTSGQLQKSVDVTQALESLSLYTVAVV